MLMTKTNNKKEKIMGKLIPLLGMFFTGLITMASGGYLGFCLYSRNANGVAISGVMLVLSMISQFYFTKALVDN